MGNQNLKFEVGETVLCDYLGPFRGQIIDIDPEDDVFTYRVLGVKDGEKACCWARECDLSRVSVLSLDYDNACIEEVL